MREQLKPLLDVLAARHPGLWQTLYRRFGSHPELMIQKDFDICIEGYPRSGNTFATVAFETSQPNSLRIAHHLHSAAQIILSVKWRIPTIILIRDPCEATVSEVIYKENLDLKDALHSWVRFYSVVDKLSKYYVLARFEEVTNDFGGVISRVNERFHTGFKIFQHTEDNVKEVLTKVGSLEAANVGGSVDERKVARPSSSRELMKEQLMKTMLNESQCRQVLKTARSLYQEVLKEQERI